MNIRRSRRGASPAAPTLPTPPRGWVGDTYGAHADALVTALPGLMRSATAEASLPSTASWVTDTPERPREQRARLLDDLRSLRAALLEIDVLGEDVDRDRRLRAALSAAIGAADNLALASRWQRTAASLDLTQAAVDSVLAAAGRPQPA